MIQEVYVAPDAAALAKVCGALLGLGFTADPIAAENLMKSKATQIATVLSFAGVRAVADVSPTGHATLTLNATTRGQLAPVLKMLSDHAVPGTSRPIASMLKSSAQAQREAAQQRQQEQQRAHLLAEAPAREAAQRAAARQEAAWRCRAVDLTSIEARLVECGARAQPGEDGLPVFQLGDTTISLRVEPAGTFGQVRLVGFTPSDFATARRIITSAPGEMLMPFEPGKVEATPQRVQKSLKAQVNDTLSLAVSLATDQQLASALRKLPLRRKAALKKALDRR